jgi:hypothetical protein
VAIAGKTGRRRALEPPVVVVGDEALGCSDDRRVRVGPGIEVLSHDGADDADRRTAGEPE